MCGRREDGRSERGEGIVGGAKNIYHHRFMRQKVKRSDKAIEGAPPSSGRCAAELPPAARATTKPLTAKDCKTSPLTAMAISRTG